MTPFRAFDQRVELKGAGLDVLVRKNEEDVCRKNGADSCIFIVSWQ